MTPQQELLLQAEGWTVECVSPLELRHQDGSFATLQAALLVVAEVCSSGARQPFAPELEELETKVQWAVQLVDSAKALTRDDSDEYWKNAYGLIFNEKGALAINCLLLKLGASTDWADPDGSYREDVCAYVSSVQEKLRMLKDLLQPPAES